MNEEIMVSINCLVYKHEKYLRKCLDGLVSQKTDFQYEILVHDDVSPDNSAKIIREYMDEYPGLIVPLFQTENQYSKCHSISWTFQFPRARGKYIAFCDGDDYWIDEYKLQKQVDIMEEHPECTMCTHMVQGVDESGETKIITFPEQNVRDGVYSQREWMQLISRGYPFQTTSYFIRAEILKNCLKEDSCIPDFVRTMPVGDEALVMFCATKGELFYSGEIMSHYRMNSKGSWSERNAKNREYGIAYREKFIQALKEFNEYTDFQYDDIIQDEILDRELTSELIKQNYRNTFDKKYRKYFRKFPLRTKLVCLVGAICPNLIKKIKSGEK